MTKGLGHHIGYDKRVGDITLVMTKGLGHQIGYDKWVGDITLVMTKGLVTSNWL